LAENFTLITGGVRSGKSDYAQRLAVSVGRPVLFVATAEAKDEEMRQRIDRHRAGRPVEWQTLEEPLSLAVALRTRLPQANLPGAPVILVDCINLLVTNLLLASRPVQPEIEALIAWRQESRASLIAVTNEAGLGVVPDNALARQFCDELGLANQALAAAASTVVLMVAGQPLAVKQAH
jgi:adenosylcobinamide kinase / adenosylcobinamide-phosphate guanylyltransferase